MIRTDAFGEPVRVFHTALLAGARLMDSKTLQLDSPLGTAKPGKSSEIWQVRITESNSW